MLFEVVLRQSFLTKPAINRWHFNSSGTPASVSLSFALISALGGIPDPITGAFPAGSLMEAIAALQADDVSYQSIEARALYSVTDFYDTPFPSGQTGVRTGEVMNNFEAFAIRSSRVRTDVGRGFKRFAGVTEDRVNGGGEVASGALSDLQDICDILNSGIEYDDEGTTLTFTSCVLGFQEYTTPSGKKAYKQYSTLSAQLDHAAIGVIWAPSPLTTTQNSRKRSS